MQQADGSHVTYTYDGSGRMTQLEDPHVERGHDQLRQRRAGSARSRSRTARPRTSAPYQEQGWTNSGTSGSPAAATLLAAAGRPYTDPNGNVTTIRPDWYGPGHDRPVDRRPAATSAPYDLNANGLPTIVIDPLNRITQYTYNSPGKCHRGDLPRLAQTNSIPTTRDSEPLTDTNADGNTTSYTYDAQWQPHGRSRTR